MVQGFPSPSSSDACSLLLSLLLHAFPAQVHSFLGEAVSSVGEVLGTLTQELRTHGNITMALHCASVPHTRGPGAGKGPEKSSNGGRGME